MAVTAYAALLSLIHVRDHVQVYHSLHMVFSVDQQSQLQTLYEKVGLLLDFLEQEYSPCDVGTETLEDRITNAAYTAEDIIETYIVNHVERNCDGSMCFSDDLQGVIESFTSFEREVAGVKEKGRSLKVLVPERLHQISSVGLDDTIVKFEREFEFIKGRVINAHKNLQIIPITGMGGIGKTTLAKKLFDHKATKQHFDVCGWVTVSQHYDVKEMLLGLLGQIGGSREKSLEVHKLGEEIHKKLIGRRYFIIMDDIWSVEAWNRVRLYLYDDNNGSRVIITTRLLDLAYAIGSSSSTIHSMSLLDGDESWSLLRRIVFDNENCAPELVKIGKEIAIRCKGLPLSINVIGGLLKKSKNREYWESVADEISSRVNAEDNERCLKVLDLSYRHLPIHLKVCFLHFGIYPEDQKIDVKELIRLWVAEGYLKPSRDKTLEEVAYDYLQDLMSRNLIIGTRFGCGAYDMFIQIHDLVRDLCLKECHKERMINVVNVQGSDFSHWRDGHRRLAISTISSRNPRGYYSLPRFHALQLRSFSCNFELSSKPWLKAKLLRVMRTPESYLSRVIPKLVNSRYLQFRFTTKDISGICRSLNLLWNLQTMYFPKSTFHAPHGIWEMPQLRHVISDSLYLLDPKSQDNIVLENLQTLGRVTDFRFTEEVLRRIPNIRELKIQSSVRESESNEKRLWSYHFPGNLACLQKLESLQCNWIDMKMGFKNVEFSSSLKKVDLYRCSFNWEDIGTVIGWLPQLESLILNFCKTGKEWNLIDGQFLCLKQLGMHYTSLESWTTESDPFPSLEQLELDSVDGLDEIPPEIGEIPTLQSIKVTDCSSYLEESAKRIQKEQKSFGNDITLSLYENDMFSVLV